MVRVDVVLAGAAALGASCVASCAADTNSSAPSLDAADSTTVSRDHASLERSGVGVRAVGCGSTPSFGSGAAVSASGLVVTVAHTIAGADDITIIDVDGVEHAAVVVAFDPSADLAALRSDTLRAPALEIGDARTGPATTLRWTGAEGVSANDVRVTKRLAITIDDIYQEDPVERTGIELAADIVVGDSGGPVIDTTGMVVGIVYANSQSRPNVGFATDDAELESLLTGDLGTEVDNGRCRRPG